MKCTECNNREAVVFVKKNINGKITEQALCEECAAKNGAGAFENLGFGLFGNSFFKNIPSIRSIENDVKRCNLCGSTFEDIRRTGKIGCAECYDVFAKELEPTIKGLYGNMRYNGSVPGSFTEEPKEVKEKSSEIETKKEELREAVADENYERAAQIRDEIKSLEGRAE